MAKKTVASLQSGDKKHIKIIRAIKSKKTGAYYFKSEIVSSDKIEEILKDDNKV